VALYHVTAKEEVACRRVFLNNQARALSSLPVRCPNTRFLCRLADGLRGESTATFPSCFSNPSPFSRYATESRWRLRFTVGQ